MPGRRPGLHFPAGSPLRATLPGHRRTRNYSPACRTAAPPGKPRRSATEGVGAGGCLRACTPAGPRADDFLRALPPSGPLTRRTTTPPPAGPQRHRGSPTGSPFPGRGRTSFAGAASRTTDEAHNDSPACRTAAPPGKPRRAAFSGPPRTRNYSPACRAIPSGYVRAYTPAGRTADGRAIMPPAGPHRARNYFPACRACSASRSSRTRRGMPTAERSRMWVSGLRIHAVSGLPGSTR